MEDQSSHPPVSPWAAGIACRCPRCGKGRLFKGLLDIAPACAVCGLDLSPHDSGDGPAVFVILFLGALVVLLALTLESWAAPPIWVHLLIWPPVIIVLSIALLRPIKATLVAFHYKNLRHAYRNGEEEP